MRKRKSVGNSSSDEDEGQAKKENLDRSDVQEGHQGFLATLENAENAKIEDPRESLLKLTHKFSQQLNIDTGQTSVVDVFIKKGSNLGFLTTLKERTKDESSNKDESVKGTSDDNFHRLCAELEINKNYILDLSLIHI